MPSEHHRAQQWSGGGGSPRGCCSTCPCRYPPILSWLGKPGGRAGFAQPPWRRQSQPAMRHHAVLRPDWQPASLRQQAAPWCWSILWTPSPGSLLLGYPPGIHGPVGSRLEVLSWHLAPCTHSEMLGTPDKSLHFGMRTEGAQYSQVVLSPQNMCWASLCKPTPKQGSPHKPRTSLSLGSCVSLAWPPPALALWCKQQLQQQLHGGHLLCLWGKLRQRSYTTRLQTQ